MTTRPPDIEIRIDELVLEGVSELHRRRVVEAIERELGRLARAGEWGDLARLEGRRVPLPDRSFAIGAERDPEAIGAQVARSIWATCRPANPGAARIAPPESEFGDRAPAPTERLEETR